LAQGASSGSCSLLCISFLVSFTMAVTIKNTFLDVPAHTFMYGFDESVCIEKRCHSVPRTWKPMMAACIRSKRRSLSQSSRSSMQSDISVCSTVDSLKRAGSIGSSFENSSTDNDSAPGSDVPSMEMLSELEATTAQSDDVVKVTKPDDTAQGSADNLTDMKINAGLNATKTKLKAAAPAFTPVTMETRLGAVTYAVYLALLSSGQACEVKIEKGTQGVSPTLIAAELQKGPASLSRCYDAIHLARQSLEEITTRLNSMALLSKRVQKEDHGYSLRSSVACVPCGAEDYKCWDLFNNGSCPRRSKCQWYHPQECDIARVKISIRCTEDTMGVSIKDQPLASLPVVRQKISLGELVH